MSSDTAMPDADAGGAGHRAGSVAIRRVVTGHDPAGLGHFERQDPISFIPVPSGDAAFALVWATHHAPADNLLPDDGTAAVSGLATSGSVLRVTDFVPGTRSPMHRTQTLDYAIVLFGRVRCVLEGGASEEIGPGDILIQRGTNHAWECVGNVPARVAFVLLAADPLIVDGRPLPEIHP